MYRHGGVGLLRAALAPVSHDPQAWPDPDDQSGCRAWLDQVWSDQQMAGAISQASPTLATQVGSGRLGHLDRKKLRRATLSTARYLLRATGRPTPFGLFAGVTNVSAAPTAQMRWGTSHQPVVRADTAWLAAVIDQLEATTPLLNRLEVVVTNLATRRGRFLEAPHGPEQVRVSATAAVAAVGRLAAEPIGFGVLVDKLAAEFAADPAQVRAMLTRLVELGVLITCLRAPYTVTDPLAYLIDRLAEVSANDLAPTAPVVGVLQRIRDQITDHNQVGLLTDVAGRASIIDAMAAAVPCHGRSPLAVDVRLDCQPQLPLAVFEEIGQAADALLRLCRDPLGAPGWIAYHRAFVDRYGTGTVVPVAEAVDADTGLGYPPTYPGSLLPDPAPSLTERDEKLLGLAWQAAMGGHTEVELTDELIDALTPSQTAPPPPHVEIAARIHAVNCEALSAGRFRLQITPARAAGVLTSRFTATAAGDGWEQLYRSLPPATAATTPVQLSFGSAYPYGENIVRIPAFLPQVLSLGEHRTATDPDDTIGVQDVALTATATRLHLVRTSSRQLIEPLAFHALDLDKQPPPLARFLARLSRGFTHGWTAFDWGPHAAGLPFLPRMRYRRTILSPARWRLTTTDLAHDGSATLPEWTTTLAAWRRRWRCPDVVEMRDDDRRLRLDLHRPLHVEILRAHLRRHGEAVLTEAASEQDLAWIGGHAHEVAVPLTCSRPPAPAPKVETLPTLSNTATGPFPATVHARWLYGRLHTHPDRHDEILASELPRLRPALDQAGINGATVWFVRYRSPEQTDHLRLRIGIDGASQYGQAAAVLGAWAQALRAKGMAARLVLDTYTPEIGRYGAGPALAAVEQVFVADSHLVSAQLGVHPAPVPSMALAALNMVGIVTGMLGLHAGMAWLIAQPATPGSSPDRDTASQVTDMAARLTEDTPLPQLAGWPTPIGGIWQRRAEALATYNDILASNRLLNRDEAIESLLHMHHNRARGIDRDAEATCRRLARHAALAWRAHHDTTPAR